MDKHPVNFIPWIIIALAVMICAVFTSGSNSQQRIVPDEEYEERCGIPSFSPRDPSCADIRPRSAPIDCSQPDFSPRHWFCTPEQRNRDGEIRCGIDFSPLPPECRTN